MTFSHTCNDDHTHCGYCGRKIDIGERVYECGKDCCSACIDKVNARRKAYLLDKAKKDGGKDLIKWKQQYEEFGKKISALEKALRGDDVDVINKCRGRSGSFVRILKAIFYAPSYIFWVAVLVCIVACVYYRCIGKERQEEKVVQEVRHVETENVVSNATTNVVQEARHGEAEDTVSNATTDVIHE